MFRIDLGAAEFVRFLARLLQKLVSLFAQAVGNIDAAAPRAASHLSDRDGLPLILAQAVEKATAIAEEFIEERASAE